MGVVVLVVVLAVMAGFEREIKSRLLGFSPHIELELMDGGEKQLIYDWPEIKAQVDGVEGVEEAYAQLRDFTILERSNLFYPVEYRAIDTENVGQMEALEELILKETYGGTADMGLDEKAVVAESTANQFGLIVGDKILLHSARNLQQLAQAWKITDQPLIAEAHAEMFAQIRKDLRAKMSVESAREAFDLQFLSALYDSLEVIRIGKIRESEREVLNTILLIFQAGNENEAGTLFLLEPGSVEKVLNQIDILDRMEREVEDGRLLRGMREVALPRELEVVGIFRTSQHVMHPAVFVPLATGQELKNLEGGVEALGVRVDDPYAVEAVQDRLREILGPRWSALSWKDQNRAWVELIARERMMMYFALSFIVLVSAFCIMAVIFTITIMKKQEIGVMKALGATPFQIVRVFTFQGSIVGLMGSLLGVGLGLLVVRFRDPIYELLKGVGFDIFPKDFHGIDGLPAHVNPQEVVIVGVGAFLLCVIAALIPAFLTSRRDPARCLRNY